MNKRRPRRRRRRKVIIAFRRYLPTYLPTYVYQCDRMDSLFFKFWANCNNEENFAKSGHIATYIDQCDRMDSFFTTIQTIIIHFQSFKILPNLVTLPSCSRLKQVLIKSFDKLDPNDDDQCDQFCQILWFILVDFELILAIFCMPFGTF